MTIATMSEGRSHGDADANLASAARYGVRRDPVDAHSCQQQADNAQAAGHRSRDPQLQRYGATTVLFEWLVPRRRAFSFSGPIAAARA
jgi:hypothetical protein